MEDTQITQKQDQEAMHKVAIIEKIKKGGYKFGKLGDTISYVIGRNILINKLTIAGLILNSFLNLFEKDHALKAVNKTDSK